MLLGKDDRDLRNEEFDSQTPIIRVIGVGGGGNNAVDRMIDDNVEGIEFIAVNTDAQVLRRSRAGVRIQLGAQLTAGLGAGGRPEVGARAAEESEESLVAAIKGCNMLFITAGMGGGTGTGAAPHIARLAKKMGILTVAVVTKPFVFEGRPRMNYALRGIEELRESVDTLLIIPNEKLIDIDPNMTFKEGLKKADEVLTQGVQGISGIISNAGMINMDFADIETMMSNKGIAHIGIGRATGKNKALTATENAIKSPLLETSIQGAYSVLVYVTGDDNLGMQEVTAIGEFIRQGTGIEETEFFFGSSINEDLNDEVVVTVVATAFGPRPVRAEEFGAPPSAAASAASSATEEQAEAPKKVSGGESNDQIVLPIFLQKNRR